MKEIFKPVVGFEDSYIVSNLGNVISLDRYVNHRHGKQLKKSRKIGHSGKFCQGYVRVDLCRNNISLMIFAHRLVAIAFIPNPLNKPYINHINSIRNDNRVENLEWATAKENVAHAINSGALDLRRCLGRFNEKHHGSKKTLQYDLLGKFVKEWPCRKEIERVLGILPSSISNCISGRYKTSGGFIWKNA